MTHVAQLADIEWYDPSLPEAQEVSYVHWLLAGGAPLPDFARGSWEDTQPQQEMK